MNLTDLYKVLVQTELPVSYNSFADDEKKIPPYIAYQVAYTENFGADNRVYSPFTVVDVSLYQKIKTGAEATVEDVLDKAGIFWDKTETYLDGEKVYQTIYEVKINGK